MELNYRAIFEASPDLYMILLPDDPRFTIADASDIYASTTLTRREDIVGRGLFEVFPDNPSDPDANGVRNLQRSLRQVLLTLRPDAMAVQRYDIQKPGEPGVYEERYWSPSNSPVIREGKVLYIIHRAIDVTELVHFQRRDQEQHELNEDFKARIKKMESEIVQRARDLQETNEKLKAAVQLREDVLAIVSHDLNNPLGMFEMSTDILKEALHGEGSDEQRQMLLIQERSIRQMKRLIKDLLSFAKIQSGNFSLELAPVEVTSVVEDGMQAVLHHSVKKKVNLCKSFEIQTAVIECDSLRIIEVLSNLLGNAIKFAPAASDVTLKVLEETSCFHFIVEDRGPGIPAEHLPHVFDRYWQARETARHGTGLGLAIAKGIIEGHKGRIWIESQVGEGTRVHFTVPKKP